MKALNIFGLILALVLVLYCIDIIRDISELMEELQRRFDYRSLKSSFFIGLQNIALDGAFVFILICLFFGVLFGGNLKNVRRKTTRVISIIGCAFTLVVFIFNIYIITIAGKLNFGVIYLSWALFALVTVAFTIVLIVQTVRFNRPKKTGIEEEDILHSVEVDFEIE